MTWSQERLTAAVVGDLIGDKGLGRTARTPAFGGADDGVGSLAARATEDCEGSAWAFKVPEEPSQSDIQRVESGDAISDLDATLPDHARQFGGRIRTVTGVAPTRDPGRLVERQIKPAQVDDQAQVLDVRRAVLTVGVVASTGPR
jgi:hypothetical protein